MNIDFSAYGGRRYLLTVGCGWVCVALRMGGYIDQYVFRDIIIATVAAYIVGNVAQKKFTADASVVKDELQ